MYKTYFKIQHEYASVGIRDLIKNDDVGLPFVNSVCVDQSDLNPLLNHKTRQENKPIIIIQISNTLHNISEYPGYRYLVWLLKLL